MCLSSVPVSVIKHYDKVTRVKEFIQLTIPDDSSLRQEFEATDP